VSRIIAFSSEVAPVRAKKTRDNRSRNAIGRSDNTAGGHDTAILKALPGWDG